MEWKKFSKLFDIKKIQDLNLNDQVVDSIEVLEELENDICNESICPKEINMQDKIVQSNEEMYSIKNSSFHNMLNL